MSKKNTINQEFKKLSQEELASKIESLRGELFSLRLHSVTSPVKDKTQYKKLRKSIARGLTILRNSQEEIEK